MRSMISLGGRLEGGQRRVKSIADFRASWRTCSSLFMFESLRVTRVWEIFENSSVDVDKYRTWQGNDAEALLQQPHLSHFLQKAFLTNFFGRTECN